MEKILMGSKVFLWPVHGADKWLTAIALGVAALLSLPTPVSAATPPSLGTTSTYGVVSSTLTTTGSPTTITGDGCYTTVSGSPVITGTTQTPCPAQTGLDQAAALADLNGQACVSLGTSVALDSVNLGSGLGVFTPGCYSTSGTMSVAAGTVTLSGPGVYIFRSGGTLNTAVNTAVVAAAGACASDVYWAPTGATTLGATSSFVGNILDGVANAVTLGSTVSMQGRVLAYGGSVTMNTATVAVPICAGVAPVTLSKSFSPSTIAPAATSTLTLSLVNATGGVATLTSALTDSLPGGVMVAAVPNASTSCLGSGSVTAAAGTGVVSLPTTRSIPANGACTVTVDVTAPAVGTYVNTIPAGALTTNAGNNLAAATATLVVTLVAPSAIPTLSEWVLIALAMLIAGVGITTVRRRKL